MPRKCQNHETRPSRSTKRRRDEQKRYLRTCAPSEDSDQPAHPRSLIRIFTGRILERQGYNVCSCEQRRLRSDCADAQADLSLRWLHVSEGTFSHFAAQILVEIDMLCPSEIIYPCLSAFTYSDENFLVC